MNINIKKRGTGEVIFSGDFESIKQCVEAAAAQNVSLRSAVLSYADLRSADLRSADLRSAVLSYADLRSAVLSYADLRSADLRYADLRSAVLSYAVLSYADLSYADLSYAVLSYAVLSYARLDPIKNDFLAEVLKLPNELEFLRDALLAGKVNGSTYNDGECGCLAGTMALAKGLTHYSGGPIKNGLTFVADSSSLRERFFLAIKKGDTPETNPASKIALEWTEEAIQIRDNIRATGGFAAVAEGIEHEAARKAE